jgi:hypothetical protein
LPRNIFIAEVSMIAFSTKALPVCLWQSVQWQQCTRIGSSRSLYRTWPQAQPPLSFFAARCMLFFILAG